MEHLKRRQKQSSIVVLIDADAFIALAKGDDANHVRAQKLFERLEGLPVVFVTTNYVFSEAVTVISQRVGHREAVQFAESLRASYSPIQIRHVDDDLDDEAFVLFKRQTSKNTSFVDCSNMALMEHHDISYIFSFDMVYRSNGYANVDELASSGSN